MSLTAPGLSGGLQVSDDMSHTSRDRISSRPAWAQAVIGGTVVDLMDERTALALIVRHCDEPESVAPLGVSSANLDHVHHFGTGGQWSGTIGTPSLIDKRASNGSEVLWLNLLDGAPLVDRARALTGMHYPRLAGSDLIEPILDAATERGLSVGFLGGSPEVQRELHESLGHTRPELRITGMWAPDRSELNDPIASRRLAKKIRATRTDILVVGLGKPRQELWIAEYGVATGAKVLLAFGAVVDFLAGHVRRASPWIRRHKLEWAWRLSLEPSRLAGRYLVQGPPAFVTTRLSGAIVPRPRSSEDSLAISHPDGSDRFTTADAGVADVAVVVVTHNNARHVPSLIKSLRDQLGRLSLRVVVADNGSTDDTLELLRLHDDVDAFPTGGNLGYAAGINRAMARAGLAGAYLVLNPDLTIEPGALNAMVARLRVEGVGAVVPQLLDEDGVTYQSLRREPTLTRAFVDAAVGSRWPNRPGRLAEIDYHGDSYLHPHPVDWATGAALLVKAEVAHQIGDWDERFFLYSEEVDYCRRLRATGAQIWYEPAARMFHARGGSGPPDRLTALMAVNRVRYAQTYHSPARARAFRSAALLGETLRAADAEHRKAAAVLIRRRSWAGLPHARLDPQPGDHAIIDGFPGGSIVIPAHNEAAVIARTLAPLAPLADQNAIEIIVVCNGCDDDTAKIANRFSGVKVIEIDQASKTDAINVGDEVATRWPRLYLDADIRINLPAIRDVLDLLAGGEVLAARPTARYDTDGAASLVGCYYRARNRAGSLHTALWGAGIYGVSRAGHDRFDAFPTVIADDLWLDQVFAPGEKVVIKTEPVIISAPLTNRALLNTLRRVNRGNVEMAGTRAGRPASQSLGQSVVRRELTSVATATDVVHSARDVRSAIDVGVYAAFAIAGRIPVPNRRNTTWERDDSTRRS